MNPFSALLGALGLQGNQKQFAFRVSAESAQELAVKSFTGSDHGLSADYQFLVTLSSQGPVWPGDVVGKRAQLELLGTETPVVIHGMISDFTWAGQGADGPEFVATLASPLHPLKLRRSNRVFLNTTVPQIIEEVLDGAELGCDFAWEIQGDYPVREYTVQYHESDWEFISRLAAHSGLFFRWEADKEQVRLLFHDGLEQLPQVPGRELLYQVQSGTSRERETIFGFNARASLLTAAAELRDYNYRTPEILLDAPAACASAVPGHGSAYCYGEHHKDQQQGQQVAKLRQQALDWQREVYLADSDCRAAIPGGRITMTGHPDAQLNREYLILQVEHQGDQSAALSYGGRQTAMTYRNRLTLIPFGTPYTPPLPEERRIHGILSAKVESPGGQYAYLDEQGRYRIRLHFDDGQATPGEASHAVRLAQTYSGENYGLHLPLHPGTEVALTCVNGDLDRPILLGALPNPATLGPVNASNPSQNILRTFGGNELLLEDRKGEERIELFTRERKNLLNLDAKAGAHKVRLATAEGTMEVQAAKSLHLESGDTHSTTSGNDHLITVENKQQLATKKAGIDLQAASDIRMKAANNIDLNAEQQDIHLKAAKNMVLQAGEGMSVEVRNQNLTLRVTGGQLSIEAAKEINILGQGGGAITIGQSGGKVTIAPGGNIIITAPRVDLNGGSINISGSKNSQGGASTGSTWHGSSDALTNSILTFVPTPIWWSIFRPNIATNIDYSHEVQKNREGSEEKTHAAQKINKFKIGTVPGYPEHGEHSWRSANDEIFIKEVDSYNRRNNLKEGDPGFWTAKRLKAQAMIESGGHRKAFETDPLQVNNPGDWVPEKIKVGLSKTEKMTPTKSSQAALDWLEYKGWKHDSMGKPTDYRGDFDALRRYNGNSREYPKHPGIEHRDWYASEILKLEKLIK